jgi:starvation-inducible DNA-binding protein
MIAERLLDIGGKPIATMEGCMELSNFTEAKGGEIAKEMVASIVYDFAVIVIELKARMLIAQTLNDDTTAEMLLFLNSKLEKHIWMLQSFLGKS